MRVIIRPNATTACITAARIIASQVKSNPCSVLGLATGGTPLACYQELIRLYKQGAIDFSKITTFNLDEYVGLGVGDLQSYYTFMFTNFFDFINIDPGRIHILDGKSSNMHATCLEYEEKIRRCGGIDLQLLGIGTDGHIAFNEPGSSLSSRTRVKALCRQTIDDNARFFESSDQVPRLAVTMGVGTILDSRQCLLLATGTKKSRAISDALEGPITSQNTASALQFHQKVIVVIDHDASSLLKRRDSYDLAESYMPDPDRIF